MGVVDAVTDCGAVGDGLVDDTAALQAWLNTSTLAAPKSLHLPPGVYRITDKLVVPFAPGTELAGCGRFASTIRQATAGKPILHFAWPDTHTIAVRDLGLTYATPQTDPGSYAVLYQTDSASANGFYHHAYNNLYVSNAYVGFGIATPTGGQQTVWDCHWTNITIRHTKHNAFRFVPSRAIGMPMNTFRDLYVSNTGGPVVADDAAFCLSAVECLIDGLDIEGWRNTAIAASGGASLSVQNVHLENHVLSGSTQIIRLANVGTHLQLRHSNFAGVSTGPVGAAQLLVFASMGASVEVDGVAVGFARANFDATSKWGLLLGTGAGRHVVGHVRDGSTGVALAVPGYDDATNRRTTRTGPGVLGAPVKAGAPVDADFPFPSPGLMVVDDEAGRLWVRVGSTWRYTDLI